MFFSSRKRRFHRFHVFAAALAVTGAATPLSACKLWAVLAHAGHTVSESGPLSDNREVVLDELSTYYAQGACNDDGWSLTLYRNHDLFGKPTVFRSPAATTADSASFYAAVGKMLDPAERITCALGHERLASSGAEVIADPHPFTGVWNTITFSFVHNGTLSKRALMALLTDGGDSSWIMSHPPSTYDHGDWQTNEGFSYVVDSELFFLLVLKYITKANDVVSGLAMALTRLQDSIPAADSKNFILSDGNNLYLYGGRGGLKYFCGHQTITYGNKRYTVAHQAVMTEPPETGLSGNLGWAPLAGNQLVVLQPAKIDIFSAEALRALSEHPHPVPLEDLSIKLYSVPRNGIYALSNQSGIATVALLSCSGRSIGKWAVPVIAYKETCVYGTDGRNPPAAGLFFYILSMDSHTKHGTIISY